MKVLIVDAITESQALYANKIQSFPPNELEILDIELKLCSEETYLEQAAQAELVILGSQLGDRAMSAAAAIKAVNPEAYLILFVENEDYGQEVIHFACNNGLDRVFPDWVPQIDLLQEFLSFDIHCRRNGKRPRGRLVALSSPKGGLGATTVTAALGELAGRSGQRVLLWDLDSDSRDLSRSLCSPLYQAQIVDAWLLDKEPLDRENFKSALVKVDETVSLLAAPLSPEAADELLLPSMGVPFVKRIIELARCRFDAVLIDTGRLSGPACRSLYHLVDRIVVLATAECVLSITATELFLGRLAQLLGTLNQVALLPMGSQGSSEQLKGAIGTASQLPPEAWELPKIGDDPGGALWPASGKTLYSLGSLESRRSLELLAAKLDIIGSLTPVVSSRPTKAPSLPHVLADKLRHAITTVW